MDESNSFELSKKSDKESSSEILSSSYEYEEEESEKNQEKEKNENQNKQKSGQSSNQNSSISTSNDIIVQDSEESPKNKYQRLETSPPISTSTSPKPQKTSPKNVLMTALKSPVISKAKPRKTASPKERNSAKHSESSQTTPLQSGDEMRRNRSSGSYSSVSRSRVRSSYSGSGQRSRESFRNEEEDEYSVPSIPIKEYSETDITNALNAILKKRQKPDPEMYMDVLAYAKKRLAIATINEDYDSCEDMNTCVTFLEQNMDKSASNQPVITIPMRIEQTKQNIANINKKYDKLRKNFEEERKLKLKEIEANNEAEMQQLEEQVASPEFLHQFDKPSSQLLHIRKMQKVKALQKDFKGAKELKTIGDNLEKKEVEEAKKKIIVKVQMMTNRLREKQENAMLCAMQNWERQRTELEQEREAQLDPYQHLLSQMENNGHQSLKYSIKSRGVPRQMTASAPISPSVTPRTMKKVHNYKYNGQRTLNLSNLEPQKYVRPKTSKSQRIEK